MAEPTKKDREQANDIVDGADPYDPDYEAIAKDIAQALADTREAAYQRRIWDDEPEPEPEGAVRWWTHGCDALLQDVTFWYPPVARCPHCGCPHDDPRNLPVEREQRGEVEK